MCPRCANALLKNSGLLGANEIASSPVFTRIINPDLFLCTACGYFGPCLLVDGPDVAAVKKKITANKKNQKDFVRKERKVMARFEVISLFLFVLVIMLSFIVKSLEFFAITTAVLILFSLLFYAFMTWRMMR